MANVFDIRICNIKSPTDDLAITYDEVTFQYNSHYIIEGGDRMIHLVDIIKNDTRLSSNDIAECFRKSFVPFFPGIYSCFYKDGMLLIIDYTFPLTEFKYVGSTTRSIKKCLIK